MDIKENLRQVKDNFLNPDCLLIAVSKTRSHEEILVAYHAGIRDFGENKVQELAKKQAHLPSDIRWHMIGHLQRNKIKHIAPFVHLIHGVDSLKLLQAIDKEGQKSGRILSCLLQVHIAKEDSKFGFDEKELLDMIGSEEMISLKNIQVLGLMGMASNTDDEKIIRGEFAGLKMLMDKLNNSLLPLNFDLKELSMGMSGDYRIAQEEGSTMVRIGSAIFGERNY
jgi:pyridoxal phosphate enzyme (YggS family)